MSQSVEEVRQLLASNEELAQHIAAEHEKTEKADVDQWSSMRRAHIRDRLTDVHEFKDWQSDLHQAEEPPDDCFVHQAA